MGKTAAPLNPEAALRNMSFSLAVVGFQMTSLDWTPLESLEMSPAFPSFLGKVMKIRWFSVQMLGQVLRAVCVSVLGLSQPSLRLTAEMIFGNLLCAKERTDAFLSAWAGRCDLNKSLFSSKFCHFEGRKKMLQPTQPIRYGLENQHS